MRLEGDVVIVTGGARGIGAGIAKRFAAEGAEVAIVDVDEKAGRETTAGIADAGQTGVFYAADVSNESAVAAMVASVMERFGRIDVLVNNAGVIRFTAWEDMDVTTWNLVLGVNLTGTMLCCKYVVPHMITGGHGAIVNMSSIHASVTGPRVAAYAATKGGIVTMTRSMALELGPHGIRANAILPGYIQTPLFMADANRVTDGHPEEFIHRLEREIPLGRVGSVDDVAGAALFLASSDSAYVTGSCIAVDAGMAVRLE